MEEGYSKDRPPTLMNQLEDVQAHIEDLHVVIDRTSEAVDLDFYNNPLCSDFSELRIDYWVSKERRLLFNTFLLFSQLLVYQFRYFT